jgi:hypothetical protein
MKKSKKGQIEMNTHTILMIVLGLAVTIVLLILIFGSSDSSNTLLNKLVRLFRG